MEELNAAIANTSNTKSVDTVGTHLSMIKKMGYKAQKMFLQTFNNSLIVMTNLLNSFREVLIDLIYPITLETTVRPGQTCDNWGWTVNTLVSLGDSVGLSQQYSNQVSQFHTY